MVRTFVELIGFGLVLAGLSAWSVPLALVAGGVVLIGAANTGARP